MSDIEAPEKPVAEKAEQATEKKMKGRVKWFDPAKGYGFLESDDLTDDVFVHHTEILQDGYRTLKDGAAVSFIVSKTSEGLAANKVSLEEGQ